MHDGERLRARSRARGRSAEGIDFKAACLRPAPCGRTVAAMRAGRGRSTLGNPGALPENRQSCDARRISPAISPKLAATVMLRRSLRLPEFEGDCNRYGYLCCRFAADTASPTKQLNHDLQIFGCFWPGVLAMLRSDGGDMLRFCA